MLERINALLTKTAEAGALFPALVLLALVAAGDHLTGGDLSFALFYLVPVVYAAWYAGRSPGLVTAVAGALVCLFLDAAAGTHGTRPVVVSWNGLVNLGFFLLVGCLVAEVRAQREARRESVNIDPLTGACDKQGLLEIARKEIARSHRYSRPFTVACIDIDEFAKLNEKYGRSTGDYILKSIASVVQGNIRSSDVVARLDEDEFVVLLPEADYGASQKALAKLRFMLDEQMKRGGWLATFSVGAITFESAPRDVRELTRMVNDLMASVKTEGSNRDAHRIWKGGRKLEKPPRG